MKKLSALLIIALLVPTLTHAWVIKDINTKPPYAVSWQAFGNAEFAGSVSDFSIFQTPVVVITSPIATTTNIVNDINYDSVTNANTKNTCTVTAINGGASPTYRAITPSIGTINSSTGQTTYVSDGTAQFGATIGPRTRGVSCTFLQTNNTATNVFNRFVDNSVGSSTASTANAGILGKTPSSTTQGVYSSANDSTKVYTRNTSIFTGNLNLTAIPAYSDVLGGSQLLSGVLISPNVMLYAAHAAKVPVGGSVYFVGSDNVTVTRTITAYGAVDQTGGYNDLYLGLLSSPVPATVTPVKLAPSNLFYTKVTSNAVSSLRVPVTYYRSQTRSMYLGSISSIGTDLIGFQLPPTASGYSSWFTTPIVGDSASPVFMVINNQPVLLGTLFGATAPSWVGGNLTELTNAITSLGGQQYTVADLSSFNNY